MFQLVAVCDLKDHDVTGELSSLAVMLKAAEHMMQGKAAWAIKKLASSSQSSQHAITSAGRVMQTKQLVHATIAWSSST